jgi:uncharacterized protein
MEISRLDRNINWKRLNDYVKESLRYDENGHDYQHIKRVLKTALAIADECANVDYDVLVAACLLHDIANRDGKLKDHHLASAEESSNIVPLLGFNEAKTKKIKIAIEDHVAFADTINRPFGLQIESKILRDAHSLDNLGSFGLVKRINLCMREKIPIFISPEDKVNDSIYGHIKFLLSLPEKMQTDAGKKLADKRVIILQEFLAGLSQEDE